MKSKSLFCNTLCGALVNREILVFLDGFSVYSSVLMWFNCLPIHPILYKD